MELFPGKDSTIVLENNKRPNLTIWKRDADSGAPVEGTVFLVKTADGHSVAEVTTGPDGSVTVPNLLPMVYEVIEKSVPSPYLLDADPQLVTLYPNRDRDVYFENHKAPTIEIIKENSITHERLANVRFQVWYASNDTETGEYNDLGVFTTDENGRIELTGPANGLRDGWFRVKELEPPTGFSIKDSDTQEVFIPAGMGHTFLFENTPLSALVVYKQDSVSGKGLSGCRFQLSYLGGETSGSGGTVIGTYTTSANGSFTVTGLKAGYYISITSRTTTLLSSRGTSTSGYRRRWHGGPASERFCRKAEKQNRASIPPSMRSVSGWSVGSVVPPISGVPGPGTASNGSSGGASPGWNLGKNTAITRLPWRRTSCIPQFSRCLTG